MTYAQVIEAQRRMDHAERLTRWEECMRREQHDLVKVETTEAREYCRHCFTTFRHGSTDDAPDQDE